jgi:hypothetical protein
MPRNYPPETARLAAGATGAEGVVGPEHEVDDDDVEVRLWVVVVWHPESIWHRVCKESVRHRELEILLASLRGTSRADSPTIC